MNKSVAPPSHDASPLSLQAAGSLVPVACLAFGFVLVGSGLQGYANSTLSTVAVALFLLVCGSFVVGLTCRGRRPEVRAFALTFAACVLVGGLAQSYSLAIFHDPQDFGDAIYFYQQLSPRPPFTPLVAMDTESLLALVTWQDVYKVAWWLGLSPSPSLAVIVNALVMGVVAVLTVAAARELFGNDSWRLRRVGTLFAWCGLFLLFGSLLLRDCFVVLFHALWLWGAVRWLVRPSGPSLMLAVILTVGSAAAMQFLRPEADLMFAVYGSLAVLCWYSAKRLNATRLAVVVLAFCALPIATAYVAGYAQAFREAQASGTEKYDLVSARESSQDSLGMRFVVGQPLLIRLVSGTGLLLVGQVPVWTNFKVGADTYHWIKGYHGIYQLLMIPLAAAGLFTVVRLLWTRGRSVMPLLFLAAYVLASLAAVAITSIEQRHFAPSMTAVMILGALPDTREQRERRRCRVIAIAWFLAVVGVHVAWAVLKGFA